MVAAGVHIAAPLTDPQRRLHVQHLTLQGQTTDGVGNVDTTKPPCARTATRPQLLPAICQGLHHHQGYVSGRLLPVESSCTAAAEQCVVAVWCDVTACRYIRPNKLTCNCRFLSAAAAFSSAVFRRLAAGTYTVPPAAAAAAWPTRPCPVGAAAYPILHSTTHNSTQLQKHKHLMLLHVIYMRTPSGAALHVCTVLCSCLILYSSYEPIIPDCAAQVSGHLWYVLYCSSKANECR
jgi:hypothetical protein